MSDWRIKHEDLHAPLHDRVACEKRILTSTRLHKLSQATTNPARRRANLIAALAVDDSAVATDPACCLGWVQRGRTQCCLGRFGPACESFKTVVALCARGAGHSHGPPASPEGEAPEDVGNTELAVAQRMLARLGVHPVPSLVLPTRSFTPKLVASVTPSPCRSSLQTGRTVWWHGSSERRGSKPPRSTLLPPPGS